MTTSAPSPADIGAPVQFAAWRPHQLPAIEAIVDGPERFVGCVLPTGAGKSLTTIAAALLGGWRTCILTSTKLLQEQYSRDFQSAGLVEIKGQGNYECVAFHGAYHKWREKAFHGCDDGPCRAGHPCIHKPIQDGGYEPGCTYYDAIDTAIRAPLVVTNYSYWFSANRYQQTLGEFDCLVLDEGHHAPMELADYLSVTLDAADCQLVGSGGPAIAEAAQWREWADIHEKRLRRLLDKRPSTRKELRLHRAARRTAQKITNLSERLGKGEWVIEASGHTRAFNPVWVSEFAEAELFHGIKKVVLTSATCTRQTAAMLGVPESALLWHEAPSDFPVERRPVVFVPTVKLDYRASESEVRYWLATIDHILRARQDRKGILHSVSYARARQIKEYSEFGAQMITHDASGTRAAVEQFKQAGPGAVLVSPSVTTGYDFPMTQCEYQIVVKIPFPDRRDPVTAARTAKDPTYPSYIAMQELVQAVGRGMRSAEDRCETLIVDSNCSWFMKQQGHLAPQWFRAAYRKSETLPEPLEKLSASEEAPSRRADRNA